MSQAIQPQPQTDGFRDESVRSLLMKGDFGLGAFASHDILIMVNGRAYRIGDEGRVCEPEAAATVEWAGVLKFAAERITLTPSMFSVRDLLACCDSMRSVDGYSYAWWLDGRFSNVLIRSRCVARSDTVWAHAARPMAYEFENVAGSLIGFWSPELAASPGRREYLFYFLSGCGRRGGVLQDLACTPLRLRCFPFREFQRSTCWPCHA